jgi:hypothetical protein
MEDLLGAAPLSFRIPPSACSAAFQRPVVTILVANHSAAREHAVFGIVPNGVVLLMDIQRKSQNSK